DRLCRRLAVLDHGRVIRQGSPRELKSSIGDPERVTLEDVFLSLTGRSLRG
ncbi:MAG: ABC transporter ATP-binding protein, partial [Gemmatimonadetes bacterium]|nr:ABC transporter ATP-binding protein [Gemmatimonadota bacterium]